MAQSSNKVPQQPTTRRRFRVVSNVTPGAETTSLSSLFQWQKGRFKEWGAVVNFPDYFAIASPP